MRLFRLAPALLLALAATAATAQSRPPIQPTDYGQWESPGIAVLSANGRWLAYGVTRVDEHHQLRLRPMDRDTFFTVPNGTSVAFGADSRWAAYLIGVSPETRERLEQDKKPVRTALGLRDLATGRTDSVPEIASFRFSPDGRYLAMRRYAAEGQRGADLIVQNLANGARMSFGNVGEFAWADRRPLLAIATDVAGAAGNGVQVYDASSQVVRVLDSSPSRYRGLAWRERAEDLAVLRTLADSGFRDTTHAVLAWTGAGSTNATQRVMNPTTTPGFPAGMRVAESRRPQWAKEGGTVYFGVRERTVSPASPSGGRAGGAAEKVSDVQVWHSKDVRIMPMQKVRESQDLQATLLSAWHVRDARVVQIGTSFLESTSILAGDRNATETDRSAYEFGTMFGRPYQDIWLVDIRTGARLKVLEKVRHFYGGSPTGRKLAWYDGEDYWSLDVETKARTNLSAAAEEEFGDPDWDYPGDMRPPEGQAGWTTQDRAFLVYDTHDIWSLAADGSGGQRLTSGAAEGVVHRLTSVTDREDGIDLARPQYLSVSGRLTKMSGYARLTANGRTLERLVYDSARIVRLMRADSSDVFAFTRERFNDPPDWYVDGPLLRDPRQVTAFNPNANRYAWGRSELVNFTSAAGVPLQAALYYPANYDPSQRYPMIVYTYERLSQGLHSYAMTSDRRYYNTAIWTANGYFVLKPDIVFRDRDPGVATLDAVVPAVQSIVARGLVDSSRIGHVGHSWGGYEAAFLPTRTHIFAASVSGAPITNLLSFAGAVHWGPGIAELDHWETGQARMGVPHWEDLDAYLRNSPVAMIQDLRTPMLMMFGDADGTVDFRQGVEFYNYARRAGRQDFVLLVYPGEDHHPRKEENIVDYQRRVLEWFGHYLKGQPAPKWMTEGMSWLERKERIAK
jgi:dipeptidyl aminopeptidase/acylaminoacyl peptidase